MLTLTEYKTALSHFDFDSDPCTIAKELWSKEYFDRIRRCSKYTSVVLSTSAFPS